MKIFEKINAKIKDRTAEPITIAFLGDSVTQGCFEHKIIDTAYDVKSAYSTRLREILNILYPFIPFNIINAGLSGDVASGGVNRLYRDVISKSPDLVVVSYGLNDCTAGENGLDKYEKALDAIFSELSRAKIDTIFLTQNFCCTKTDPSLTDENLINLSKNLISIQNGGVLKKYFESAKRLASEYGVKVCDIYSVWEKLAQGQVDTTDLLANKLNHPIKELHYYIAIKLLETIFSFEK